YIILYRPIFNLYLYLFCLSVHFFFYVFFIFFFIFSYSNNIYILSLHDALPILPRRKTMMIVPMNTGPPRRNPASNAKISIRFRALDNFKLNFSTKNNISVSRGPAPRLGVI